jgi:hypothetical protein
MRKKRKGWLFEFPLIATDDAASPKGIKISPDPYGPNAQERGHQDPHVQ